MKKIRNGRVLFVAVMMAAVLCGAANVPAAQNIGSVVAIKGTALIERDSKAVEAKVKDGIQLKDTVETKISSKTKMLFIDDSVLTVGEKAKVVIKDFVYSKDKGGKSILNLLDGKMRSVVGKAEFEVHTPTAVAAARGTVFECETGETNGKASTTCTSYEGVVEIRSIDPTITGKVSLRPGMTVTVVTGQPVPAPTFAPGAGQPIGMTGGPGGPGGLPAIPPLPNPMPPKPTSTPVNIGIGFPTPR